MSYGGKIATLPGQTEAEEFSTLVHELAHEMLQRPCVQGVATAAYEFNGMSRNRSKRSAPRSAVTDAPDQEGQAVGLRTEGAHARVSTNEQDTTAQAPL